VLPSLLSSARTLEGYLRSHFSLLAGGATVDGRS